MSKAFTKETEPEDDLPEEPPALPEGVKNYMTPQGFRRMQEELSRLVREERPKVVDVVSWAAAREAGLRWSSRAEFATNSRWTEPRRLSAAFWRSA